MTTIHVWGNVTARWQNIFIMGNAQALLRRQYRASLRFFETGIQRGTLLRDKSV